MIGPILPTALRRELSNCFFQLLAKVRGRTLSFKCLASALLKLRLGVLSFLLLALLFLLEGCYLVVFCAEDADPVPGEIHLVSSSSSLF